MVSSPNKSTGVSTSNVPPNALRPSIKHSWASNITPVRAAIALKYWVMSLVPVLITSENLIVQSYLPIRG